MATKLLCLIDLKAAASGTFAANMSAINQFIVTGQENDQHCTVTSYTKDALNYWCYECKEVNYSVTCEA